MKNLILLALALVFLLPVSAQRNKFYYGDKDNSSITASVANFDREISKYEARISSLQKENERLIARFERSSSKAVMEATEKSIVLNDELIAEYRQKLLTIEDIRSEFLAEAAGKDKQAFVASRGNNPVKLQAAADAYTQMVYADAYVNAAAAGKTSTKGLKGIVLNKYYRDAHVVVHGPAGFRQEFFLDRNKGQAVFEIPMPGDYTAVFNYGEQKAVVSKPVELGPGKGSFIDGEKYDFSAMLMKRY